jgi:hypothetical protein
MKEKIENKRYEIEFSVLKREAIEIDATSAQEAKSKAWEYMEMSDEHGRGSSDWTHGWEITYVGELTEDEIDF